MRLITKYLFTNLAIVFCIVTCYTPVASQTPEDSVFVDEYRGDIFSEYPFLDESKNELFLPSNLAMSSFFDKLKALENNESKKTHIVHIGDSHIQADYFSGKVRELFKEDIRFPMHGRGFTFPYRVAKTNNPMNYSVRYSGVWEGKKSVSSKHYSQWGLSGITAVTSTPNGTIAINPNRESVDYDIKRVKVFYPVSDPSSFEATLLLDSGNVLESYLTGDGYMEFVLLKPQSAVTIKIVKSSPSQSKFVLQGVLLESEQSGVVYSATGLNGAEVPTYFRCDDFNKQLAQLNPDLIIISLGTNDAYKAHFDPVQFHADYRKLISGIRKYLPDVDILLTTAGDSYRRRKPNKHIEQVADQLLSLAKEMHVAVWDFYRVMGGLKSIKSWKEHGLCANDLLHLSQKGYELQGELFFQALDMAYEEYCSTLKQN